MKVTETFQKLVKLNREKHNQKFNSIMMACEVLAHKYKTVNISMTKSVFEKRTLNFANIKIPKFDLEFI